MIAFSRPLLLPLHIDPSLREAASRMTGSAFCDFTRQVRDHVLEGNYEKLMQGLKGGKIAPSMTAVHQILTARAVFLGDKKPEELFQEASRTRGLIEAYLADLASDYPPPPQKDHLTRLFDQAHELALPFRHSYSLLIFSQELTRYVLLDRKQDDTDAARDFKFGLARCTLPYLADDPGQALPYVAWLVERIPLPDLPIAFFPLVFSRIRPRDFSRFAEKTSSADLKRLAGYYASSLPWEKTFWNGYLESPEPEAYLKETFEKVQPWRRGAVPTELTDEALRWVYAGLDHPEDLPFDVFREEYRYTASKEGISFPEKVFLDRPFTVEVRLKDPDRIVKAECLPCKTAAEAFVAHVSEEQDRMDWDSRRDAIEELLKTKRFQFWRIVAEGRLAGMIYAEWCLHTREGGDPNTDDDNARLLMFGIRPRSTWPVDLDSLLDGIAGSLRDIAQEEGYGWLAMGATHPSYTGVHARALETAIKARFPREFPEGWGVYFMYGEEFRVVWSK